MSQKEFIQRESDPLIQDLIREVREFRNDLKPIREFMTQVDAAKKAAIWIVGIFASMGAAITWMLSVREHLEGHLK